MQLLRKIFNKRRLSAFLACIFIFSLIVPSVLADGLSQGDIDSIYNDTVWYDTGGSIDCSPGGSVSSTLPSNVPEPYNSLLSAAASASNMNPNFLAAIYLSENGNTWKPFNTTWLVSPAGAAGPFQFMPLTWAAYKTDGNNDGVEDINNMYDAAYSAAKLLVGYAGLNAPLGSLDTPYKPNTITEAAAAYNWGAGNVQIYTTPTSSITGDGKVPIETQNYIKNVYSLISSGFTKSGNPNYGDPSSQVDPTDSSTGGISDCSSGIVSGNIVQTALNLAWGTQGHGKDEADAKPSYQIAMPKYNGSAGDDEWSDCGVFVATVMVASGADPNYVKRGTSLQISYIQSHPEKYSVFDNINSTSDLQEGDILINSQHTYIYTGQTGSQANGYNAVGASLHGHVPQVTTTYFDLNGEHFLVVRLK